MRPSSSRLEAVDHYRGFATMVMVLMNYSLGLENLPRWLQHTPDIGLTITDLGAPVFIFAIALTHGLSVGRRLQRDGWGKTVEHFLRRYMALFGIGALIAYGQLLVGESEAAISWNVLQSIAIAGVLTLFVARLDSWHRAGIALVLLASYQFCLDRWWLDTVLHSGHGGLLGSLSWAAMLILATVCADLFHKPSTRRWVYPITILMLLAAGGVLALVVPMSKNRVSASYVLLSVATSGLLFWIFHLLVDHWRVRIALFAAWGRNPLLLYLLHNLLLAAFVLPGVPAWYPEGALWLAVLQATVLLGVMSWIGWQLYRREWIFSL